MLKTILGSAVMAFCLFAVMDYALSLPDVHVSYATNECVSVINYDTLFFSAGDHSCENLPSKYNHVWVQ